MRLPTLFILLCAVSFQMLAQTVEVIRSERQLGDLGAVGYEVNLTGNYDEVSSSLLRYLKGAGKAKTSGDFFIVSEPVIAGKQLTAPIHAFAKANGEVTMAWIGTTGQSNSTESQLKDFVYQFGVNFYRDRIQVQIDEAQQALEAVEKQQSKLKNQHNDLVNRVERNKAEKLDLETRLKNNEKELIELNKKLVDNRKAADSVAIATDQIQKMVEAHRDRQRKVR